MRVGFTRFTNRMTSTQAFLLSPPKCSSPLLLTAEFIFAEVKVLQNLQLPDLRGYGTCRNRVCLQKTPFVSDRIEHYKNKKLVMKKSV